MKCAAGSVQPRCERWRGHSRQPPVRSDLHSRAHNDTLPGCRQSHTHDPARWLSRTARARLPAPLRCTRLPAARRAAHKRRPRHAAASKAFKTIRPGSSLVGRQLSSEDTVSLSGQHSRQRQQAHAAATTALQPLLPPPWLAPPSAPVRNARNHEANREVGLVEVDDIDPPPPAHRSHGPSRPAFSTALSCSCSCGSCARCWRPEARRVGTRCGRRRRTPCGPWPCAAA